MERYGRDYRRDWQRGFRRGREPGGYGGDFNRGRYMRSGGRFGRGPGSDYMAGDRNRGGYGRRYDEDQAGWGGYRADMNRGFGRRDFGMGRSEVERDFDQHSDEGYGRPWRSPRAGDRSTGYDTHGAWRDEIYQGSSRHPRYDRDLGDQIREGWHDLKRNMRDAFGGGGYDRDYDRRW